MPSRLQTSPAIIVGSGVTGLSTAYHLARKGIGKIIVLDKGPVGDGSSSRAAGIITGLLWTEPEIRARKKSLQLFRQFSQELANYKFQDVGCLNLFDAQSWPEREKLLPMYRRLEAPFEILAPGQMRERWSALHVPDGFTGLFDPLGGYSEPDEYVAALANKSRELGVEIRENQKVTGFLLSNGRVTGVKTEEGAIEGDAVICTVYAWTLKLLEGVDLRLPIKAFVHQRYVTRPLLAPVRIPAINANPLNGYVRPASGKRLLVGVETSLREEYRVESLDFHMSALSAPPELKTQIMRDFVPLLPELTGTSWESERVGLLTFSMDGEPILGPVGALPGFFVGVGFHSGGFAYNPVAGMLLAEYVADGRATIDVRAFSPDRFARDETDDYLAVTLAQKDVFRRRH
jgi:sarcosine oxidase, subunit beta